MKIKNRNLGSAWLRSPLLAVRHPAPDGVEADYSRGPGLEHSAAGTAEQWIPASAGMTEWVGGPPPKIGCAWDSEWNCSHGTDEQDHNLGGIGDALLQRRPSPGAALSRRARRDFDLPPCPARPARRIPAEPLARDLAALPRRGDPPPARCRDRDRLARRGTPAHRRARRQPPLRRPHLRRRLPRQPRLRLADPQAPRRPVHRLRGLAPCRRHRQPLVDRARTGDRREPGTRAPDERNAPPIRLLDRCRQGRGVSSHLLVAPQPRRRNRDARRRPRARRTGRRRRGRHLPRTLPRLGIRSRRSRTTRSRRSAATPTAT